MTDEIKTAKAARAIDERVEAVHASSTIVDMAWTTNPALTMTMIEGRDSLDRAVSAGISAASNTIAAEHQNFRQALDELNKFYMMLEVRQSQVAFVQTADDIRTAKRDGKLGSIIHFQTASPLEDDWPNTLPILYRLGLRVMQLTYNERNLLGSGCMEPHDDGLTAYGAQIVRAMNRMGIMIDLSHVGHQTAMDAIRLSKAPVAFTHCNAAVLTEHPRNISDETIKALRDNGGIVGAVSWDPLCVRQPGKRAELADFLDHLDYLIEVAGEDHVGLGSDINENFITMPIPHAVEVQYRKDDGGPLLPDRSRTRILGFERLEDVGNVTRGMIERGYSDDAIQKVLGGNFMRVADTVW